MPWQRSRRIECRRSLQAASEAQEAEHADGEGPIAECHPWCQPHGTAGDVAEVAEVAEVGRSEREAWS